MNSLHDWQLHAITLDWKSGELHFNVSWESEDHRLSANGVHKLIIPHEFPWGPSNWINEVEGPKEIAGGLLVLKIEMQSGDVIEIVARNFVFPPPETTPAAGQLPLGK